MEAALPLAAEEEVYAQIIKDAEMQAHCYSQNLSKSQESHIRCGKDFTCERVYRAKKMAGGRKLAQRSG